MADASKFRVFVIAALVVVAVLLSIMVVRQITRSRESVTERLFRETRSMVANFEMRPMSDSAEVLSALEAMDVDGVEYATRVQLESMRSIIADLVVKYYVEDDPAAYAAWRLSGERTEPNPRVTDPDGMAGRDLLEVLRRHGGNPEEVDQAAGDFDALFAINWEVRRSIGDGANVATAICESKDGAIARFVQFTSTSGAWPGIGENPNEAAFGGGSAGGARSWFLENRSLESLVSQQPSVLAVQASIFFDFEDGIRRPVHFRLYWDEAESIWRINEAIQSNFPEMHLTWPWDI
jgi:hypothetical protein